MGTKQLNLSQVLFSKVQCRVLAILYGHPARSFYTNEIIQLANSGTGAVQRELVKLVSVGLINVKKMGNQKQYQVNRNANLFPELRSIVLKTFGLAEVINGSLQPIVKHIDFAFIYGSIAKSEDKADSDIDLMLIGDNISYSIVFPLLEKAQKQLERSINPTCYSLSEWGRKRKQGNNFIIQILKQPKIMLIGEEDDLEKFR